MLNILLGGNHTSGAFHCASFGGVMLTGIFDMGRLEIHPIKGVYPP